MLRKVKKTVKGTKLARKIYPNHVDLGDGNIEIEVKEVQEGLLTAEDISKHIANLYKQASMTPDTILLSPKQFKSLQDGITDGKINGAKVKVNNYVDDDKITFITERK